MTNHNLIRSGRVMFALGIIALGILQFFVKDIIIGRPPPSEPGAMAGKWTWAYASALLFIVAICLLLHLQGRIAAIALALFILVFSFLSRHLPAMWKADREGVLWSINAYKTLALAGGALIIAASFTKGKNGYLSGKTFITIGILFLSIFFIDSGLAHFKFDDFIKNDFMLPYIPFRAFWTYFAGIALIAAAIGFWLRPFRRIATMLAGLMILLWFFLLHIPRAVKTPEVYSEWMGVAESFAFSGVLFVLAGLSSRRTIKQINRERD